MHSHHEMDVGLETDPSPGGVSIHVCAAPMKTGGENQNQIRAVPPAASAALQYRTAGALAPNSQLKSRKSAPTNCI